MKNSDVPKSISYFDILKILSKGFKDIIFLNFSKSVESIHYKRFRNISHNLKKCPKFIPKGSESWFLYWSACTSLFLSSHYHFKFFLCFRIMHKTRVKCIKPPAAMYACIIGLSSAFLSLILFACCSRFWGYAGQDAPSNQ